MNKHNVINIEEFIRNKRKVHFEQLCLDMLDKMGDRISEMQIYVMNCKAYLENMATDGHIKKSFANNLMQQIDLISMAASAAITRRK